MKRPRIAMVAAAGILWFAAATAGEVAGNAPPSEQRRPQEEAIAATTPPYREELVTFSNPAAPGVQLAGALTLPSGPEQSGTDRSGNERFPAIVMIAGSGRNDRNEEFGNGHRPLLVLADALTRQGFAVLRYDKRGIAKSTGDYSGATTLDFASDVTAAITYLGSRPDIDIARVGLIGHSEGGTIAAIVAAQDPGLAFIVMMAPAALPGGVLVAEQNRRMRMVDGETKEAATEEYKLERRLYAAIAASKEQREAEARVRALLAAAKPKPTEAEAHQAIHFTELPFMRFILAYDPTPVLQAVRVPALALNGSKDLICPADLNVPALRKALAHDRDVTVVELPGLNHFFQHAETGSPREFATIEETLAPEVLSLTAHWVAEHTARPNIPSPDASSPNTPSPNAASPKTLLPPSAEIHSVLAHPVFGSRYACIEHGADSLQWDLGDALGTDCFIEELTEVDGRSWPRPYKGTGEQNEDWYGWHQNVLSPCTCRVTDLVVNHVTNQPGVMTMEQASKITFTRADGVVFVLVHFDSPGVHPGDALVEGQVIAQVGNNGRSHHPHIHIGAYKGSEPLQIRFNQRFIQ